MRTLLFIFLLSFCPVIAGAEEIPPVSPVQKVNELLERAVQEKLVAGGVVVVGTGNGILQTVAQGTLDSTTTSPPLDEHTIFDLASLTKVVATTPAVMKLLEEGKISLADPIGRWFPEFRKKGLEEITILHLLTHTSGLSDFNLHIWQGIGSAIRKAAAEKGRLRAGTVFNYADINFILLGELVKRVTGEDLDRFTQREIYGPIGARSTMFRPPRDQGLSIAPTQGFTPGIVQDMNARRLRGIAGHAGLFSSASDLALFARMVLGKGAIDGKRIFAEKTVRQMTTPYYCSSGKVIRALGWDIDSPFSAPRGGASFSEGSFGHTGYSGSSIWIDPQRDLFVILLTNRTNYADVGSFNDLRRNVSAAAAGMGLQLLHLDRIYPQDIPRITETVRTKGGMKIVARPGKRKVAILVEPKERLSAKKGIKKNKTRKVRKTQGKNRKV